VKYLLDTNVFLWFIHGDKQLSQSFQSIIQDSNNELYISHASIWEIAIKFSLGKLTLKRPFKDLIPGLLEEYGFTILPIKTNIF
jgi:PIN domain nuclease of toxin-antitoxin system